MIHRVMQRVDVVLDQRLREAIATVVQDKPDRCFRGCAKKSNRWCATRYMKPLQTSWHRVKSDLAQR